MVYEVEEKVKKLFQQEQDMRKIVFWYDGEQRFSQEIANYQLESIQLIHVNQQGYFLTKYIIEKQNPKMNYLLYFSSNRPENKENPLLDMLLYSEEFQVDGLAQLVEKLAIKSEAARISIEQHRSFFLTPSYLNKFELFNHEKQIESESELLLALLCSLTNTKEMTLLAVLIQLFYGQVTQQLRLWKEVEKYDMDSFFWSQMQYYFGYIGPQDMDILMQSIFKTKTAQEFDGKIPKSWEQDLLNKPHNSVIFINHWMNQKDEIDSYQIVSEKMAESLKITQFIKKKSVEFLAKGDTFKFYDKQIIILLALHLVDGTLHYDFYEKILIDRRYTYWFQQFESIYQTLIEGTRLLRLVHKFSEQKQLDTKENMWHWYEQEGYEIDAHYRRFYYELGKNEIELMEIYLLKEEIEKRYKQVFLIPFSEKWTHFFESDSLFQVAETLPQRQFYQEYVASHIENNHRVFVIISDAFRYDIAHELMQIINMDYRLTASIESMRGVFPSTTEFGMAALLPNNKLGITTKGVVQVNDKRVDSLEARLKILKSKTENEMQATAYHGKDILAKNRMNLRQIYNGSLLNYIYHNTIDSIGDQASSENQIFNAIQIAMEELTRLIKKLVTDVNASKIIITADHGFIYTVSPLKKFEKTTKVKGDILSQNRRYMLNLLAEKRAETLMFQLDVVGNHEIVGYTPHGVHRFAIQGGGSNYVHGGILPQETLIPVLQVKTERGKEPKKEVQVQFIGEQNRITNEVTYLDFFQIQPVSHSHSPKRVHVYLEDNDGRRISNEFILLADSYSEESEERLMREKLILFNQKYELTEAYFLIIQNESTPDEQERIRFVIDLIPNQYYIK
ncbi:BREX-1 system phosphatase PglZ type A [Carnobacterium gallinarum]|uniref:BREX-1 system phosphatase PglZ type A n=1 Tax=Carnobacterium gallinarum TaxID=2749 RepID=UPI0005580729|nr:BREX-1 system phosphatase PglZ type A [Carnobacterium gallinarum]